MVIREASGASVLQRPGAAKSAAVLGDDLHAKRVASLLGRHS